MQNIKPCFVQCAVYTLNFQSQSFWMSWLCYATSIKFLDYKTKKCHVFKFFHDIKMKI